MPTEQRYRIYPRYTDATPQEVGRDGAIRFLKAELAAHRRALEGERGNPAFIRALTMGIAALVRRVPAPGLAEPGDEVSLEELLQA